MPQQTLHVGDRMEEDLVGARTAGVTGLLVDRAQTVGANETVLGTLMELVEMPVWRMRFEQGN